MSLLAEASNQQAGWAVVGAIVMAALECLRRLLGWLFFRDKDKADFRAQLIAEMAELRTEVKECKEKVERLTFELALERVLSRRQRELKHHYRGRLSAAALVLEMYRAAHGRMEEDTFNADLEEPDTESSPLLEELLTKATAFLSTPIVID
jgi:hypothetical protein